jgi:hypothetical protein
MSSVPVISNALQERLDSARQLTDSIFRLLTPEALYSRPIPERHRLIFYLGHLEAFDWNLICRKTLDVSSLSPHFDTLFEFGIDPPVGQAATDQPSDWPGAEEVQAYNRRVRGRIDELLDQAPEQIVQVALEHRLMHAETLAYLLHNLPYDQKAPSVAPPAYSTQRLANPMIEIAPGVATLGQKPGEFGWDNEFDEHQLHVPGFHIGKYKITNGQYLDFVREGAPAPHFWTQRGDGFIYRGMFSEIPLPLNAPVYVTHAALDGQTISDRNGVSSSRVRNTGRRRASVSVGPSIARSNARQFRLSPLGPCGCQRKSSGRQRLGRIATGWERLGVDSQSVRSVSGIPAHAVLSRIFTEFLRRRALRYERRVAGDGCLHAAPFFP